MAAGSLSQDLNAHLRWCLLAGISEQRSRAGVRHGINGACHAAPGAYLIAIAAWEAFLNETLASWMSRGSHPTSALWRLPPDDVDRWSILSRTQVFPDLLFGRTFDPSTQPFQDFAALVKVRNLVTHYHMDNTTPKVVTVLAQRKVFLTAKGTGDFNWNAKIACTEGIRWAINTIAAMAAELRNLAGGTNSLLDHMGKNFSEVSRDDVEQWYQQAGIDIRDDVG